MKNFITLLFFAISSFLFIVHSDTVRTQKVRFILNGVSKDTVYVLVSESTPLVIDIDKILRDKQRSDNHAAYNENVDSMISRFVQSRRASNSTNKSVKGLNKAGTNKSSHYKNNTQQASSKSNIRQTSGGRCQAITKKGTRCKRNADPGSNYCWQHKR